MPYFPHHSKNRWPVSDGVTKTCRECRENKPVGEFWTNRKNKDNLQARCKGCSKTAVYSYRTTHEGRVSIVRSRLKNALSHYRLTEAGYNALLAQQDGACAICLKPERTMARNGGTKRLAVDHCHATGKVRGLLCIHCNQAIGRLNDDPELIRRAAEYVERCA